MCAHNPRGKISHFPTSLEALLTGKYLWLFLVIFTITFLSVREMVSGETPTVKPNNLAPTPRNHTVRGEPSITLCPLTSAIRCVTWTQRNSK